MESKTNPNRVIPCRQADDACISGINLILFPDGETVWLETRSPLVFRRRGLISATEVPVLTAWWCACTYRLIAGGFALIAPAAHI